MVGHAGGEVSSHRVTFLTWQFVGIELPASPLQRRRKAVYRAGRTTRSQLATQLRYHLHLSGANLE